MTVTPSASFSLTLRVRFDNEAGILGEVTSAIGHAGGSIGAVDIVQSHDHQVVRDIAVDARSTEHWDEIIAAVNGVTGVELLDWTDRTFKMHEGGKIAQHCSPSACLWPFWMPIVDDITMRMLVARLGPHGVGEVVVVFREIGMHVRNHVGIVPRPKA